MPRKMDVERSREIRLWISMIAKGFSTFCLMDYVLDDGRLIKNTIEKSREKINEVRNLKNRFNEKKKAEDVYDTLNKGL